MLCRIRNGSDEDVRVMFDSLWFDFKKGGDGLVMDREKAEWFITATSKQTPRIGVREPSPLVIEPYDAPPAKMPEDEADPLALVTEEEG